MTNNIILHMTIDVIIDSNLKSLDNVGCIFMKLYDSDREQTACAPSNLGLAEPQ